MNARTRIHGLESALAVVVAVNDNAKFEANVVSSPGLRGIDVIPVYDARSAADAFYTGKAQSAADWILYCHQDVCFPEGSGKLIEAIVDWIPESEAPTTLIGFVGVNADRELVGSVNDRGMWLNGPESDAAQSIDELAVILHRDCIYRLDPALGWHLWATDLCLQALDAEHAGARVIRVPLAHNSSSGRGLPRSFNDSARVLFAKYPQRDSVLTLVLSGRTLHRSQWQ